MPALVPSTSAGVGLFATVVAGVLRFRVFIGALLALALAPVANATSSTWLEAARSAHTALERSVDAGYITEVPLDPEGHEFCLVQYY